MFREAKVGDRVWSLLNGWGVIIDIAPECAYPLRVKFKDDSQYFNLEGKTWDIHYSPTLFWDEVKIEAPPRPKRKVKKVIKGWMNIYPNTILHDTKDSADCGAFAFRLGEAVYIHHEYEVEE